MNIPAESITQPQRGQKINLLLIGNILSIIVACIILLWSTTGYAQDTIPPGRSFNKKKFALVMAAGTSVYSVTMAGLYQAWYKENTRRSFHFFDDLREWQQVDKAGHLYSAYHLANTSTGVYTWTGLSHKKSVWLGSLTSFLMMTPIEVFDGFSKDYGASWADMAVNTAGAALNLQRLIWNEPRIHPKFSFHLTPFADLRPNMLGNNLPQRIIKDYNGQTYWLSFDIQPWLGKQNKFPAWLNLALGYGAGNMVYSHKQFNRLYGYDTYRQYYLSMDVNLTRIAVKNKFIRSMFFLLNTIHIPAPALEFNKKGMKVHPLYF